VDCTVQSGSIEAAYEATSGTKSGPQAAPPNIGFDESSAGYSLASCSPEVLVSISPAREILNQKCWCEEDETIQPQGWLIEFVSTEGFTP